MRSLLLLTLASTLTAAAQYGAFDAKTIALAKAGKTLVVLDDGNTGYNQAIMNAAKADWKFTATVDFINSADLATQPLEPGTNYLMRIMRNDAEKHDAIFLALVAGWKQKKGELINVKNGAVEGIPATQELASIMIDHPAISSTHSAMCLIYVKHLQDFLQQVETGKISDKATADRLYLGRTHKIKDMELWMSLDQLDKTVPDKDKAGETYTHTLQTGSASDLMNTATQGNAGTAIADVVITGAEKTKWCFKRIFNANTGELMYLRDDAALFGKKEGFITEDFRMLEQSR